MSTGTPGEAGPDFDWEWGGEGGDWVPPPLDTTKPSSARVYDYLLGGKDNYPIDRAAAAEMMKVLPDLRVTALANRGFLVRAVRMMAQAGVRQFIDLGTGVPTSPNVHEVAQEIQPDARVVYVDIDPIVLAHNRALLARTPTVVTIQRDLRQPDAVLTDPKLTSLIDFSEPVGLLMIGVLHFVLLDVAPGMVKRYCRDLVPGSYLVLSAGCHEGMEPGVVTRFEAAGVASRTPFHLRSVSQIERLFEQMDLLEPGLVDVSKWRGDDPSGAYLMLAGVGVKK
jgi:hypothetical protein